MIDHLSRQAAIIEMMDNNVDHVQGIDGREIVQILEDIPAADVVPVIHARWIKTEDGAECEKCGREAVYQIVDDHWEYEPFCPHCGAIMDNKKGNKND